MPSAINGFGSSGGGTLPDATAQTKGALRLSRDLAGTADAPLVPALDSKASIAGGSPFNYVNLNVPVGVDTDWKAVSGVYMGPGGQLWFKPTTAAQAPAPATTPIAYSPNERLSLASTQIDNEFIDANGLVLTNGSPDNVNSRQQAQALIMAVLGRNQALYDIILTSGNSKLSRSDQAFGKNLWATQYNVTTPGLTTAKANASDNVLLLGALIRAWNLWGRATDRDQASLVASDIKYYLTAVDEGRSYLVMDTDQHVLPSGAHHNFNSSDWWANELGAYRPQIFRMAKTFTGDIVFDQLVAGFYDLLTKSTQNAGPLATTTGLPPAFCSYDTASHQPAAITNGSNGWLVTLSTDFDQGAGRVIAAVYEDYKTFNEPRALSYLQGAIKTFYSAKWTAGAIYNAYTHTGGASGTTQDAFGYLTAILALTAGDATNAQAAAIRSTKVPTVSAQNASGYYFPNMIQGGTAVSSRDQNLIMWTINAQDIGVYPDLAIFGTAPNAGTTTAPGAATVPPPTSPPASGSTTTSTPPASSGTGLAIPTWYAFGAPPATLTQTQRQSIARSRYDKFVSYCFTQTGMVATMPAGAWRVYAPNETFNGGQSGLGATVSEGIGYGMLATVYFGNSQLPAGVKDPTAQTYFDGFWKYYNFYKNAHGLMNWCIKSDGTVSGSGGASDGDYDTAMALVMAHRIWGSAGTINYGAEATKLINAIRDFEMVPTGRTFANYMTNGDQWGVDNDTYFPDYFSPGWYREFYAHTGDTRWLDIINVNYPVAQGTFYTKYTSGLQTDINRAGNNIAAPEFGYNNVRYPWRITADYVWNGTNTNTLAFDAPNRMTTVIKSRTANVFASVAAQPAVDYSYVVNGNNGLPYLNATYAQAYGVGALVSATHSQWATDALNWLNTDTEQNYFGRSLACMSAMLMAGIMVPGTPAAVGTTTATPTPVVVTPPPSPAPTGSLALFQDKTNRNSLWNWYAGLTAGTKKDRALWAASVPHSFWSGIDWDPTCTALASYVSNAVAAGQVPQCLAYSIPARDLGQFSAGGAANQTAYENWVTAFANAIGTAKAIVAYEPDSLTQADGLGTDQRAGRIAMMTYGIQKIKQICPNAYVYVDIGHSAWKSVDQAAALLQEVKIENANGFAINVSNYRPDSEAITYGQAICAKLNLPNINFVYDSGRNGNATDIPGGFANIPRRRFGKYPQFGGTGVTRCDGWIWWKAPGESDGNAGDGAPAAGTFWPTYIYNDSVGDNVNTDLVSTSSGMLQRSPTPGVAQG